MPFTVITLKNTPNSLRGDLTKWMQEISTGVYIGNFNTKIRDELWKRVLENVENGEATISYTYRNEIGYDFKTHNTNKKPVYYDGLPLVMEEKSKAEKENTKTKKGFSNAAKYHKAKVFQKKTNKLNLQELVYFDLETDGLDENKNNIIEIGAIKVGETIEEFHRLIKIKKKLPEEIIKITGIKDQDLENGTEIKQAIKEFVRFIKDKPLVGYNIRFDLKFINAKIEKENLAPINNKTYDIMNLVKKENQFIENYKLQTVLKEYGIEKEQPHRALEDAKLTYQLSLKVNKFLKLVEKK